MISTKTKLHLSFLFFLIASLYGLLLRINFFLPFDSINHYWLTQGHSHVAFLGWGFLATSTLLNHYFLSEYQNNKRIYDIIFVVLTVSIIGMYISFPLEGYRFFSISFLSIFGLTSYVYCYHFLKDLSKNAANKVSTWFVKWSFYYYLISSIAIWLIGPIIALVGKTDLYYNGVYFYLHFLYNGFFVFALFGIFLNHFQEILNESLTKNATQFFILTNIACIPAYSLSIIWGNVSILFNVIGFIAAFIQLLAFFYLFLILKKIYSKNDIQFFQRILIFIFSIAYLVKLIVQLASSFPVVMQHSLALKSYFIIGYIHLFTLLFMSVLLILFIQLYEKSVLSLGNKVALSTFLLGVFITEILLFFQGFYIWIFNDVIPNFNWYNLLASLILFTGLCFYYLFQFIITKTLTNK